MKQIYQLFSRETNLRSRLKKISLGIALFLGSNGANAQVSSYGFSQSTGNFTPLTGGNVLATATAAGATAAGLYNIAPIPVTMPFAFNFNGENYSNLVISSNGFITFGATSALNSTTLPLSYVGAYDGAISAWGRSLNSFSNIGGKTGDISTDVVGSAPNREFVIQWKNFRPIYATSISNVYAFSFQIRLKETSNTIDMVYDNGSYALGSSAISGTAQMGLRGETIADYNNRFNATSLLFGNSSIGTAATSTQAFNTTAATPGMPSSGLTYTWTPPSCFRPTKLSSNTPTTNGMTISWQAPTPMPSSGFEVYYSTSATAPDATTVASLSNISGNSVQLSTLTSGTTYYIYVRSLCSVTQKSEWTDALKVETLCGPVSSYYTGFEDSTTGAYLPLCWNRLVSSSLPGTLTTSTTTPAAGAKGIYLYTSATSTYTPSVAVLPELDNLNAGTHWLRFRTRITVAGTGTLQVGYVTNGNDMTTFNLLGDILVTNTAWSLGNDEKIYQIPAGVTIPAGARLALRTANDGKYFYIDELYWEAVPTCFAPSGITSTANTSNSISIAWNAATPIPTNGYEIYYSTSNTSPTASTSPSITGVMSTATTITGLLPLTQYFVWIRSKCSATEMSAWSLDGSSFNTICQPPSLSAVTGATFCSGQTATLSAMTDSGATINWYEDNTIATPLATGTTFTTPALTATTNYWVSSSVGSQGYVGISVPVSTSGNSGVSNLGMIFDAHQDMMIETVDVYPMHASNTTGTITIELRNAGGATLASATENVAVSPTGAYNAVPLNFAVPAGTDYKLVVTAKSTTIGNFIRESGAANYSFPYILSGICTMKDTTTTGFYYYLYNWKVSAKCESPRQQVTATLDAACLGTSEATKKNEIKVYPNPFHDVISISDIANAKSLSVMDISGRVIRKINEVTANSVNLSDLKEGLYILQLTYKDGSISSHKVIKK
ncbi:fibronectin type III domain-containing protein [Chryseobacterium sp.]|uniref:fibronectin type III domain-containing protein n=1 Tax=Chryseobacterium sp. TaxID=1871047 RepID=UPI00388FBCAA